MVKIGRTPGVKSSDNTKVGKGYRSYANETGSENLAVKGISEKPEYSQEDLEETLDALLEIQKKTKNRKVPEKYTSIIKELEHHIHQLKSFSLR